MTGGECRWDYMGMSLQSLVAIGHPSTYVLPTLVYHDNQPAKGLASMVIPDWMGALPDRNWDARNKCGSIPHQDTLHIHDLREAIRCICVYR